VLLPGLFAFPNWWKGSIEFLQSAGIHMPTDVVASIVSTFPKSHRFLLIFGSLIAFGYVVGIPTTGFMAKRGLFIGREPNRICFPGGQEGSGAYLKEKEIFGNVGLHVRESPIDLWLLGFANVISGLFMIFTWNSYIASVRSEYIASASPELASQLGNQLDSMSNMRIPFFVLGLSLLAMAALRRGRAGRA
jgi:hypothetical protein